MSSLSRTISIVASSPVKEVSSTAISIPTPITPGSEEWRTAQLTQKKIEAELDGTVLSPSQIKRFKQAIAKNAQSLNDKRILEENTLKDESVRKQMRKDAKKQRHQLVKQTKIDEVRENQENVAYIEALALYDQCHALNIAPLLRSNATSPYIVELCQKALIEYMKSPMTSQQFTSISMIEKEQSDSMCASARSEEIFRDVKTGLVSSNQKVEGEVYVLPLKKKKKKKNTLKSTIVPAKDADSQELYIDWGENCLGQTLTKTQQRQIATGNKAAYSA
jgi:hypothetical protein